MIREYFKCIFTFLRENIITSEITSVSLTCKSPFMLWLKSCSNERNWTTDRILWELTNLNDSKPQKVSFLLPFLIMVFRKCFLPENVLTIIGALASQKGVCVFSEMHNYFFFLIEKLSPPQVYIHTDSFLYQTENPRLLFLFLFMCGKVAFIKFSKISKDFSHSNTWSKTITICE